MTYILEDVSIEDRKKILEDIAGELRLVGRFAKWTQFCKLEGDLRWAVDRAANSYLFRSPSFVREIDNEYHFFYEGRWFVVAYSKFSGKLNNISVFTDSYSDFNDMSVEMKHELRQIFCLYGLHGYGPDGVSGDEGGMYRVLPKFAGEELEKGPELFFV